MDLIVLGWEGLKNQVALCVIFFHLKNYFLEQWLANIFSKVSGNIFGFADHVATVSTSQLL